MSDLPYERSDFFRHSFGPIVIVISGHGHPKTELVDIEPRLDRVQRDIEAAVFQSLVSDTQDPAQRAVGTLRLGGY